MVDMGNPSMGGIPQVFGNNAPLWHLNPRPLLLWAGFANLSAVSGLRVFSVRFQTCTPRYRSFLSISRMDEGHHACMSRVRGGCRCARRRRGDRSPNSCQNHRSRKPAVLAAYNPANGRGNGVPDLGSSASSSPVCKQVQSFGRFRLCHINSPGVWICQKSSTLGGGIVGGIHVPELVRVTTDPLQEVDSHLSLGFGL